MTSFQRARSEEQRTERRRAILATAAAMLAEMPVAQVSLNELSRRVGLAKSNVLRYFESREAVLLELLGSESRAWLAELDEILQVGEAGPRERGDRVAAIIATSLAGRPVLCDLVSAQAAVLERNVSPEVAATYKRAAIAMAVEFSHLLRRCLPEFDTNGAMQLAGFTLMSAGTIWASACPSDAMLIAYDAHPELAALRLDFADTLRRLLEVLISGMIARA